jgi:hypothetical protein
MPTLTPIPANAYVRFKTTYDLPRFSDQMTTQNVSLLGLSQSTKPCILWCMQVGVNYL